MPSQVKRQDTVDDVNFCLTNLARLQYYAFAYYQCIIVRTALPKAEHKDVCLVSMRKAAIFLKGSTSRGQPLVHIICQPMAYSVT